MQVFKDGGGGRALSAKKLGSGARWAVNWSELTARNVGGQAMPMASSKAEGSAVARTDRQADGVTWVQKRPF
jgi:hypothetical protein